MSALDGECDNERAASEALLPKPSIETSIDSSASAESFRKRSLTGGFGLLSLAAMALATLKSAQAAEPNVAILDDDRITYKDLEHGAFELVTKEAIPRHIIVDDPGETVIIKRIGSSVSVNPVGNNATKMEELAAAQQEALANYAKGPGAEGSSAPPFSEPGLLEPINFIESNDSQAPQHALAPIPVFVFTPFDMPIVRQPPPPPLPPTLNVLNGPTEIDTSVFDTFTATTGTFSASGANGAPLTFGIAGGTVGSTVVEGAAFDVSRVGDFGTLFVNSSTGAYTFVPNNDAINALQAPTTQTFPITVSDGSQLVEQDFTINIDGSNDAAHISGTTAAVAIEAGGRDNAVHSLPAVSGMLTDTDVDNPPNTFTAVDTPMRSAGGYGTFTITANGVWTYVLDNSNAAVQALNVGDKLVDTFTVTTIDGTPQVVTVTIDGTNDAAIISGKTCGSVTEPTCERDGWPIVTATGTLTDTDVDNPPNTFTAVCSPTRSAGGYGTFTMTAAGVWTYTLDTDNYAVRNLGDDCTLTDCFTVTTIDGTPQVVTITIHGAEDDDGHHHDWEPESHASFGAPLAQDTTSHDTVTAAADAQQITHASADTASTPAKTDTISASAGNATSQGGGAPDTIHQDPGGDHWAHGLATHSRNDHFVFLSSDHGSGRWGAASDFNPKSDRIDLAALNLADFAIVALDSSSSSVPAHAIAWIYNSSTDQTTVYLNSTDHSLSIGDTSLVEIHVQGMLTIEPSELAFAPEPAALAAAAEPTDPGTATAHDGTAAVVMVSADSSFDASSDAHEKRSSQTSDPSHNLDTDRNRIELSDHAGSTRDDESGIHTTGTANDDVVMAPADAQPSVKTQHAVHAETAIAPDQPTLDKADPSSNGSGTAPTPTYVLHTASIAAPHVPDAQDVSDAKTDLDPDKQGLALGHDWTHWSRGGGQFNFSWNNDDRTTHASDFGLSEQHKGASMHDAELIPLDLSSTTQMASAAGDMSGHKDHFHFNEENSGADRPPADPFHVTHHASHDLIV